MIKIGDFARLGQVSVVTLRHYDEIGLLKPSSVDPFSGYRYYSASQLARLNRILALKDLGLSLKQIEEVLDGLTLEQLVGMLKLKRSQTEQIVADQERRLARISARLKQIELEESVSGYDVVLKEAPAMVIASRRVTVPTNAEVPRVLGDAFDETYALIKVRGTKDAGPCLAIWHQAADVLTEEDVEASVPLERTIAGNDRVRVYELPATQVVSAVHHGDFSNFNQAHAALLTWMEANGYRATSGYREVYLHDDPGEPANAVTEIQYPVERST